MRDENARLTRRLELLELREVATSSVRKGAPTDAASGSLPQLTVIKLKPKVEPAPKLATQVAVVEPAPELVEELATAAADKKASEEDSELDPALGDQIFEAGVAALKIGNVVGGIEKLQLFASENPKHPKADNALYFSGVGLIGLNDFDDAARSFQLLIATYPAGDAVVDAMLKLAECQVRLNQQAAARTLYGQILASYPGTPAASMAQTRLSSLGGPASNSTGSP